MAVFLLTENFTVGPGTYPDERLDRLGRGGGPWTENLLETLFSLFVYTGCRSMLLGGSMPEDSRI